MATNCNHHSTLQNQFLTSDTFDIFKSIAEIKFKEMIVILYSTLELTQKFGIQPPTNSIKIKISHRNNRNPAANIVNN